MVRKNIVKTYAAIYYVEGTNIILLMDISGKGVNDEQATISCKFAEGFRHEPLLAWCIAKVSNNTRIKGVITHTAISVHTY